MPSFRSRASGLLDRVYPRVVEAEDTADDRIAKSVAVVVGILWTIITSISAPRQRDRRRPVTAVPRRNDAFAHRCGDGEGVTRRL